MQILRKKGKAVIKFRTPSGVEAVIAADASAELLAALRRKLEHKLRRSGHLQAMTSGADGRSTGKG